MSIFVPLSSFRSTFSSRLIAPLLQQVIRSYSSDNNSKCVKSFKSSDLEVTLTKSPASKPCPNDLQFGKIFTDHMLEIDWSEKCGWAKPIISPIKNLSLHPASKVLHYALELFEGMKAYRGDDNIVRMFRPDKNMERMRNSAKRCAFPDFDGDELVECIKKLVNIDREWVPYSTTASLYLRPTMIGTEPTLGVDISSNVKLFVIMSPVALYQKTDAVSLFADLKNVRAWQGGTGNYKMGSNYAPTIAIQRQAKKDHDCDQILWLYGKDRQITECGAMNIFIYWINEDGKKELVTPPLSQGVILPGVTRLSVLELAKKWAEFRVCEKVITMSQITKAVEEKRMLEVFGTGTAAIISPVKKIVYDNKCLQIPTLERKDEAVCLRFKNELSDIYYGRGKCSPWMVEVPVCGGDGEGKGSNSNNNKCDSGCK